MYTFATPNYLTLFNFFRRENRDYFLDTFPLHLPYVSVLCLCLSALELRWMHTYSRLLNDLLKLFMQEFRGWCEKIF
jgi:hypothetical protein